MRKNQLINQRGFTIIEVVLVLAIAGLIFLMVFIALPALQRSQRDTQRSDDISRLQTALNNFQTNNRGAIPGSNAVGDGLTTSVAGHIEKQASGIYKTGSWGYFYDNYLLVGSGGGTDTFADPDGSPYSFIVSYCSASGNKSNPASGLSNGANCQDSVQRSAVKYDDQAKGNGTLAVGDSGTKDGEKGHSIGIVLGATCQGETVVASSGARKVAMIYKKEGGGVICLNN